MLILLSTHTHTLGAKRMRRSDSGGDDGATLLFQLTVQHFLSVASLRFALIEAQTAERGVEFTMTRSFHNRHFRWMFWELVIR